MIEAISSACGYRKSCQIQQDSKTESSVYSCCLGEADKWCDYYGEDY